MSVEAGFGGQELMPVAFDKLRRLREIAEANLLDAQIFGQFTFASDKIRRGLGIGK